jgi:hypothetical protein
VKYIVIVRTLRGFSRRSNPEFIRKLIRESLAILATDAVWVETSHKVKSCNVSLKITNLQFRQLCHYRILPHIDRTLTGCLIFLNPGVLKKIFALNEESDILLGVAKLLVEPWILQK